MSTVNSAENTRSLDRKPTPDERMGMAWWNGMTPQERIAALRTAATPENPHPSPAEAWETWKSRP